MAYSKIVGAFVLLGGASAMAQSAAPPHYELRHGVMIAEAEDAAPVGAWKLVSDPSATGGAYLYYDGENAYANDGEQAGMSYCFTPERKGDYQLRIRVRRSRADNPEIRNDWRNDVWVRLQPSEAKYPRPWIKLFFGGEWDTWVWGGSFDLHAYHGKRPEAVFHIDKPGKQLCIEVAGRSEKVQLDRLQLTYLGANEDEALPSTRIVK